MRPTVTVERITRSVIWNGNAARSQSASTDKVSRGCARGKYLGGSDFAGVRSITANPSWTDLYGK